jgi:hypothetical protein
MPEKVSAEYVAEVIKQIELILSKPNIRLGEVEYDKFFRFWRSNNFIQHSMPFNLVYDYDNGIWHFMRGTDEGYLHARMILDDREFTDFVVFDDLSVPATNVVTHDGLDVTGYSSILVQISTTASATVYVQFSDDLTNWYDLKTSADADLSWNCNNEKICFLVPASGHYFRVVVLNGASAITLRGSVSCQV